MRSKICQFVCMKYLKPTFACENLLTVIFKTMTYKYRCISTSYTYHVSCIAFKQPSTCSRRERNRVRLKYYTVWVKSKHIIFCYLRGILVFHGIFVVSLVKRSTDQFLFLKHLVFLLNLKPVLAVSLFRQNFRIKKAKKKNRNKMLGSVLICTKLTHSIKYRKYKTVTKILYEILNVTRLINRENDLN